ncbi:serine/threonine-protein kinase [Polyangium sp. y55x31]|uniref:serine/threonine-protein kinase n=1 Tax=Polyangium sp. y55x31 TaxID=3042688 RepID=UPI0024826DE8|nr:serine/threonine-protein kinase [Polyangium sp. y55x31]MDI1482738.1 AAA family ATPase [Polyangium sp. y55x31]
MGAPRKENQSSERFSILRRLGAGGFGVVYEAIDLRYGARVALKVLYQDDAAALLRFKQEFRVLADITHPNLVMLHELIYDEGRWALSMEFVEGEHLLSGFVPGRTGDLSASIVRRKPPRDVEERAAPRADARPLDSARLRFVFSRLVRGVRALHAADVLHLDLKPSNVLLTNADRVVILDFGLARELSPSPSGDLSSLHEGIVGTPAYMAPEQIVGEPGSRESDWYSVGVMLYEALAGRLPFEGSVEDVLCAKLTTRPIPPSLVAEHVPEDLEELCLALLRSDPRMRPSDEEIAGRLKVTGAPAEVHPRLVEIRQRHALVGREREMAALFEAFRESSAGRAVLVRLSGASGVGKSALASTFLAALPRWEGAIVLRGRCHDRESVPYKALDSLVDALARYVKNLPREEAQSLVPPNLEDLERIFPVLGLIDPAPAEERAEVIDPPRARIRAFQALKDLLRRLAARGPLVLCIDDLQWGDVDSAELLFELLSPPDAPPMLLLACHRSDDVEPSVFVSRFGQLVAAAAGRIRLHDVDLGPLTHEQAIALAMDRLGPSAHDATALAIVRESEGNPFSIEELARHVRAAGPRAVPRVDLREAMRERLSAAPAPSRRLLEIVAVAGRPLEQDIAFAAAELADEALAYLTPLRSAGLLRVCSVHERPGCEVSHDRLRDAILATLDVEALAARHQRLASVLETSPEVEPEELAMHFQSAGERYKAAHYATTAADRANEALAFAHAAELYALALDWGRGGPADTPENTHELKVRRAHALAHAGRCRDAAELYLACADGAPPREALDLRRRAIEQLFVGGHLDEGNRVLSTFLPGLGLRPPRTTASVAMMAFRGILRIRRRGYDFQPHDAAHVDPAVLARIDVCMAVSMALTDVDPLRSCAFLIRGLGLALDAGEPARIAQALGTYAQLSLLQGGPSAVAEGARLLARAAEIASGCDDPDVLETVTMYGAATTMIEGRWRAALDRYDAIGRHLRSRRLDLAMYHNMAHVVAVIALDAMGRLEELAERTAAWHREATSLGNLFAAISASSASAVTRIAADDVEEARRRVREGVASWTRGGMHVQHMYALRIEAYADLYEGRAAMARRRVLQAWGAIVRSQQLRVQPSRIDMLFLRARTALAIAADAPPRRRAQLAREAERIASRLEHEIRADAAPSAALLRAAAARLHGREDEALAQLDVAIRGFDEAEMALHAACARRRKGELSGGDSGRALVAVADTVMEQRGVRRPDRWAAIFAPGLWIEAPE